jgi:hypothetical protein
MIPERMERTVRGVERQAYTAAVTDLWERLAIALARLERIAENSADELTDEHSNELPSLQYALHAGAELAVGIDPPLSAAPLHAELVDALGEARDSTADIAFALENGDSEAIEPLLLEWRGALFRVRLARLRAIERSRAIARARSSEEVESPQEKAADRIAPSAIVATALILGGAFLFTAGAVLVAWPVWAAGLALFAGGFILYRP